MAFDDLWAHQYCLTCDKQVQVDGAAYCSEACRLAESERSSTPGSQASSPGFTPPAYPWSSTTTYTSRPSSKFYLTPAYDFANAQPYGSTPVPRSYFTNNFSMLPSEQTKPATSGALTPSSSHASLCSMQSSTSTDSSQLSDVARKELQAYAVTFEQVRIARRRSQ